MENTTALYSAIFSLLADRRSILRYLAGFLLLLLLLLLLFFERLNSQAIRIVLYYVSQRLDCCINLRQGPRKGYGDKGALDNPDVVFVLFF